MAMAASRPNETVCTAYSVHVRVVPPVWERQVISSTSMGAAERYDGVVFCRTGRDFGRMARALGLRDVEGLAMAVHGEESLEALGRSRRGTALRRGIHHDQHSPEGVHAVHVHSPISSSSSRRWRSRAGSTW